ncbi:MAG: hypothetical protein A2007_03250 [Verrucomicrobia bacterium GWC2_42_7]|nr:MAG: hypothetical protein A2007_03250 [Verrucomicrobia bacterium GWC2_42_7]
MGFTTTFIAYAISFLSFLAKKKDFCAFFKKSHPEYQPVRKFNQTDQTDQTDQTEQTETCSYMIQ